MVVVGPGSFNGRPLACIVPTRATGTNTGQGASLGKRWCESAPTLRRPSTSTPKSSSGTLLRSQRMLGYRSRRSLTLAVSSSRKTLNFRLQISSLTTIALRSCYPLSSSLLRWRKKRTLYYNALRRISHDPRELGAAQGNAPDARRKNARRAEAGEM